MKQSITYGFCSQRWYQTASWQETDDTFKLGSVREVNKRIIYKMWAGYYKLQQVVWWSGARHSGMKGITPRPKGEGIIRKPENKLGVEASLTEAWPSFWWRGSASLQRSYWERSGRVNTPTPLLFLPWLQCSLLLNPARRGQARELIDGIFVASRAQNWVKKGRWIWRGRWVLCGLETLAAEGGRAEWIMWD